MNIGSRRPSRLNAMTTLALSALALGGIRHLNLPDLSKPPLPPEEVDKHKRFMATLNGPNARAIWQRRFRRGLTPSEAQFIEERINEST